MTPDPGERRSSTFAFRLALALFALTAVQAGLPPVGEPDLWFHLATGDWILEHGRLPAADPFAHTSQGTAPVVHSWGMNVLLAGTRAQTGYLGLRLLLLTCVAGGLVACWTWLRRLGYSRELAGAGAAVLLYLACDRLRMRPEQATFVCLWLALSGLWQWSRAGLRSPWSLLVPGLLVVWANLHPGGLTLPILAGAACVGWTAVERLGLDDPPSAASGSPGPHGPGSAERLPWLAPVLLGLAFLVQPHGWTTVVYGLRATEHSQFSTEWLPSWAYFQSGPARWPLGLAPWLGLLALGWGAWNRGLQRRWLLLGLGCFVLALLRGRLVWLALVPLAVGVPRCYRQAPQGRGVAAALLLLASVGLWATRPLTAWGVHGPTLRPDLPWAASRWLAGQDPDLRLGHPRPWGGFLADRRAGRIFVDGRLELYPRQLLVDTELLFQRLPADEAGRAHKQTLLEQYDVEALVLLPGSFTPLGFDDRRWQRRYGDAVAEVWLRR